MRTLVASIRGSAPPLVGLAVFLALMIWSRPGPRSVCSFPKPLGDTPAKSGATFFSQFESSHSPNRFLCVGHSHADGLKRDFFARFDVDANRIGPWVEGKFASVDHRGVLSVARRTAGGTGFEVARIGLDGSTSTIPIPHEGEEPPAHLQIAANGTVGFPRAAEGEPLRFMVAEPDATAFREITIVGRFGEIKASKAPRLASYAWELSPDGSTIALGNSWLGDEVIGLTGIELFRVLDGRPRGRLAVGGSNEPRGLRVFSLRFVDDRILSCTIGTIRREWRTDVFRPENVRTLRIDESGRTLTEPSDVLSHFQTFPDGTWLIAHIQPERTEFHRHRSDGTSDVVTMPVHISLMLALNERFLLSTETVRFEDDQTWRSRFETTWRGFPFARPGDFGTIFRWHDLEAGSVRRFHQTPDLSSLARTPGGVAICVAGDRNGVARIEQWDLPPATRPWWWFIPVGIGAAWLTSRRSPLRPLWRRPPKRSP